MKLREVAERWASEIGKDEKQLAIAILEAATQFGEFDMLPKNQGLVAIDSENLRIEPIRKGPLVRKLRNMAAKIDRDRNSFIWASITLNIYYIHRASIALFADKRELPLPSWWCNEPEEIKARPIIVKELTKVLWRIAHAGERLKESELRRRVMADPCVAGRSVSREVWREALKALPDGVRRRRGQTDKAVANAPMHGRLNNPRR